MYEQTFSYEAHGQTLVIHLPKELDHHNCRNLKYEICSCQKIISAKWFLIFPGRNLWIPLALEFC